MDHFSKTVLEKIKYYVYLYSHPLTGEVFYVGKGKGNRVFSHLEDASESDKSFYIKELKSQNLQPKIEILVHGLDNEEEALRVEASIIDLLGIHNLTNVQLGYRSREYGRMTIDQINSIYKEEKVKISEPSILIRINQAFRYNMSAIELYDYTRGVWKLNPQNAAKARYAFAVYHGTVQEVYEIFGWYEAGSTLSVRTDIENPLKTKIPGRYEFVGMIANKNIRDKYRFKSVTDYFEKGNSNPIMYLNF